MRSIENKVALITGGTKGIGYGIAEAMLKANMKVAITGRTQEGITNAISKLAEYGDVVGIVADVRDASAMRAAADQVTNQMAQLDVVIANAGVGHFGSITELTDEQWSETLDINLTGVFNTVRASIPALKETKGYIFTIASLAGANFFAKGSAYNASKFGLVGFTQAMMLDLRQEGINVSTIMPGSVATYFNNHTPNEEDHWKIQIEDLGQMVVDMLRLDPRTLPSKIEVRPSQPPVK
ncbi:SDR family oxidoreductase [Reichenbachiella agariperforans]|uniref:SDR family oxidoreductase n=1 Tax=Reichenbachiella agariperforans TaxID=156994 RepID=UPI001C08BFD6|nr:SDR family oxidoreductase [Reichenbachiella agariperforans]MBU2913160.1 SDR family oxidoreductase [Reichenbachiella agariperforans]